MIVLTHHIAGITIRTETDMPIPHLLASPFDQFHCSNVTPDVYYRICQITANSNSSLPLDDDVCERLKRTANFPSRWLAKSVLNAPEVRTRLQDCLKQPELVFVDFRWERAILRNFARNEVDFFYVSDQQTDFGDPLMQSRYRNVLAPLLPNLSALMLHSSGVVCRDKAVLFLAPDEGGKTTVVKLAEGKTILGDDQVIVRRQDNQIIAHGTPFGAVTNGPLQARLGGWFILEKASHFELIPVCPLDVLEYLWREHLLLWVVMPRPIKVHAFQLLADACHQAPCYRMRFPKDYVDWDAIDKAMAK